MNEPSNDLANFLVDCRAAEYCVDNELIPLLRDMLYEYNVLDTSMQILTAGGHALVRIETDIMPGLLTNNNGVQHQIDLRCLILPKLGRNLFSSLGVLPLGVCTTINEQPLYALQKARDELHGATAAAAEGLGFVILQRGICGRRERTRIPGRA